MSRLSEKHLAVLFNRSKKLYNWSNAKKYRDYCLYSNSRANMQDFAYTYGLVHLCLSVFVCVTIVTTGHTLEKIKNVKNDVCRLWHLPSNGVIAKIVLHDLDLLFEGKNCDTLIYLKLLELANKCVEGLLYNVIFAIGGQHCTNYTSTLTYFFRAKNLKCCYLWNSES